jgi:cyanoexosortase B-associated protein
MLLSVPKTWSLSRAKLILLIVLTTIVFFTAAPSYLSQKWRWTSPLALTNLPQMKAIKQSGIDVPGWTTTLGQGTKISEHQWFAQDLRQSAPAGTEQPAGTKEPVATVLLRPQTTAKLQPQLEWADIEGAERWQSDSMQTLQLQPTFSPRFFRAWTKTKTYAVVQWYAQPGGGTAQPSQWYIADRLAQWQQRRVPWVAVSIQMPIPPLDDLSKYRSNAEAIAHAVQTGVSQKAFGHSL